MSQQHIPQPNSQSAAPAEVFDSTADAPHGQTVSALGTPGPRAGEVIVHTGQKNTLDFSIDRQFIPIDTFIWSTTQPRGTLLWSSPVHPQRVNPLVAYLSEIYNTWGGGIEFNFKVAGTGFHAGALAFVRIPPNVKPNQFSSPTEWGAFEYVVMDPKTLEVLSIDVMDQRQLNFHFMKLDEEDPTSFGGYIACYVLIPLNTSSTGTQQIAVQSFARPGATFTMNQIIMPGVKNSEPAQPTTLMDLYSLYFNSPGLQSGENLRYVHTAGKEVQRALKPYMTDFGGDRSSSLYIFPNTTGSNPQYRVSSVYSESQFTGIMINNVRFAIPGDRFGLWATNAGLGGTGEKQTFVPVKTKTEDGKWTYAIEFRLNQSSIFKAGQIFQVASSEWISPTTVTSFDDSDYFTIPTAGEQFFFFGNLGNDLNEPMPLVVAHAIYDNLIRNIISKAQVVLMDFIDIATNLNLFTCKLYYEGFITVSDKIGSKLIKSQGKFVFNSFALRTSIIPTTPSQMVNLLLTNSLK